MHLFLTCCLFLLSGVPQGEDPQALAAASAVERGIIRAVEQLQPDMEIEDPQPLQALLARERVLCDPLLIQRHPETDTTSLQQLWEQDRLQENRKRLLSVAFEACQEARERIEERQQILESLASQDPSARVREGTPDPSAVLPGLTDLPESSGGVQPAAEEGDFTTVVCPAFSSSNLEPSGTFINPVPTGWISAGTWTYPEGGLHLGLDLASGLYSQVLAPASGLVVYQSASQPADSGYLGNASGYPAGAGNSILLLCPVQDRLYAVAFYHLSDLHMVRSGQSVSQGDVIALSGNAGNSTGPHTHIEITELKMDLDSAAAWFSRTADFSFGTGWSVPGACSELGCRRRPEELIDLG